MEPVKKNIPAKMILDALDARGITRSGIARDLCKSPTSVNDVIHGKVTSHFIRSHIAACIGRPVEEIWPETYFGNPNPTKKGRPLSKGLFGARAAA